jgi:hypothetical protein
MLLTVYHLVDERGITMCCSLVWKIGIMASLFSINGRVVMVLTRALKIQKCTLGVARHKLSIFSIVANTPQMYYMA